MVEIEIQLAVELDIALVIGGMAAVLAALKSELWFHQSLAQRHFAGVALVVDIDTQVVAVVAKQ